MPAPPLDCLGIAAHPDDMEILAGGLLALLASQHRRTGILDLTRGERGSLGSPSARRREWTAASRVLGLAVRRNLGLPDGALEDDLPSRRKLAQALRDLRPALVVSMPPDDHHPDHRAASGLVFNACWMAGMTKAPGLKGRPFRPRAVLHAVGHRGVEPSLIVDVSAYWKRKVQAMRCYASQFAADARPGALTHINRPGFLEMMEARARILGFRIGVDHGEAFRLQGPLIAKDPWAILSAGAAPR